jgi:hypothetical protein
MYFRICKNTVPCYLKNTQISDLMKLRTVGAELFYADRCTDRQTDMTKLVVFFRNFANAPKNEASNRENPASYKKQQDY